MARSRVGGRIAGCQVLKTSSVRFSWRPTKFLRQRIRSQRIRDHCKVKIEKHKSEVSRLREDREHKKVQIAQLTPANLELKSQVDEVARRDRVLSSNLVASFLKEAVSGQPLLEESDRVSEYSC